MPNVRNRLEITGWLAGVMVAALLASILWAPVATAKDKYDDGGTIVTATFEGEEWPMDEVWEVATACVTWEDESIECFRTTEEREEAERERSMESPDGFTTMSSSSCPVRLYALTYYGGAELTLNTRLRWHNLAGYGFSNRASSYRISGCYVTMRDGSHGSGSTYPGVTSSWTWSSTMAYGWNNRVSSVWIH